jgi:Ca-activated chloride channel family protein
VVFAGRAYTVSPLTTDHGWLLRQLERVRPGMIEDGTALGDGVMVALERLGTGGAEGNSGGRRLGACVVLLTDGVENAGLFSPKEARERAVERGVPVFAIAAGRNGKVRVPFRDGEGKWRVREELAEVDEDTLHLMALATGGKFFRGPDARTVAGAFGAIADLRPTERTMRVTRRRTELFPWLAGPGAVLLVAAAWGLARRRGVEERGK